MANVKLEKFSYDQIEEANVFINREDIDNAEFIMRDQGIFIRYNTKRENYGLTAEQHIAHTKDAIAEAEADLVDALIAKRETELGAKLFHGKSGMKKIAEAYDAQFKKDYDTVNLKKGKVMALREILKALESGDLKVGLEAVNEEFAVPLEEEPQPVVSPQDYQGGSDADTAQTNG